MNILPKKRWHVRTKENIARVRKDEAEAAEKERQERLRIENADREARLNVLKQKSKQHLLDSGITESEIPKEESDSKPEHVNLFINYDQAVKAPNKAHDKEVKEKQEEYEKKIGYLTYLGQDTNEALKKKNWYEVLPDSSRFSRSADIKDTYEKLVLKDADGKAKAKNDDVKNGEVSWKSKQRLDPLNAFKKFCPQQFFSKPTTSIPTNSEKQSSTDNSEKHIPSREHRHKSKKKKHKKDKEDKDEKIKKLREARLKREQAEKRRAELLLTKYTKPTSSNTQDTTKEDTVNKIKPKYNSQFNPELARQNYR